MISYFLNLFPEFYDIEVRVRVRKYTYGVRKYESSFVLSKVLSYFRTLRIEYFRTLVILSYFRKYEIIYCTVRVHVYVYESTNVPKVLYFVPSYEIKYSTFVQYILSVQIEYVYTNTYRCTCTAVHVHKC